MKKCLMLSLCLFALNTSVLKAETTTHMVEGEVTQLEDGKLHLMPKVTHHQENHPNNKSVEALFAMSEEHKKHDDQVKKGKKLGNAKIKVTAKENAEPEYEVMEGPTSLFSLPSFNPSMMMMN